MPLPSSAIVIVFLPLYLVMPTRTVTGCAGSSGLSRLLLTYSTTILGTVP